MNNVKSITTGYSPRPLQHELHSKLKRFNILVCHRRFGKTVFSANHMIHASLQNKLQNPQYAYIAPTYKQAKMIAWDYFRQYSRNIPGFEENKSELTIYIDRPSRKDRIKLVLLGADNPDSLRGIYLDGVVLDEYAQCPPNIWGEIVRPTLTDRKGWAIFIGTPKGQDHFFNRYEKAVLNPAWFTCVYKASETGIIAPEELLDMKNDMDDSEYMQEMECSFTAALIGSYYGKILEQIEQEKQIGDFPYDPAFPVDTFWDLGIDDSLTIWFRQKMRGNYRYIDYYEENGKALPEIAKMLKSKEYAYGRHVIPWDGKARELGSGLTRQEILRNHGIICEVQKRQAVADRIQAARICLRKSVFDVNKCIRGINALRNYQREWDEKAMIFKDNPKHDWASHGADSYGYSALDGRESYFSESKHENLPRGYSVEYDEFGG